MCINPSPLSDGTLIGCRNCKQCFGRRVLDWQGRCIAESKTTAAANAITLTYGRSARNEILHPRSVVLTYSDVQKYFKRLRKDGYPCTYFVVGEFGGRKGRTHWHAVVFWHGPVPEHELDKEMYMQEHWPHGFSHWKEVHSGSVAYACKYIQKDLNDAEAQGKLAMSKKPPIGSVYFAHRAQQYVDQGLSPQNLFYTFPEAVYRDGKPLRFMLSGRSKEMFLEEYIWRWRGYPEGYRCPGRKKPVLNHVSDGYQGPPHRHMQHARTGFQGPPCPVRGWWYPSSRLVEEFEDGQLPDRILTDGEFMAEFDEKRSVMEKRRCVEEARKAEEAISDWRVRQYVTRMSGELWDE